MPLSKYDVGSSSVNAVASIALFTVRRLGRSQEANLQSKRNTDLRIAIDSGLGSQVNDFLLSVDRFGLVEDVKDRLALLLRRHTLRASHDERIMSATSARAVIEQ